jgi:hypothetical protein
MRLASVLATVLVVAVPPTASAERGGSVPAFATTSRSEVVAPLGEPVPPTATVPAPAIDPLAGAPRPEAADGVIVPREKPSRRRWLRAALFVPRVVVAATLAPVRFVLWAEDTHRVRARTKKVFWNDKETVGLYPMAGWDGGKNARGGAVFVHEDVLGASVQARATVGTVERVLVSGAARVEHGRGALELSARHRDAEGEGYFGIGDGDAEVSRYGVTETSARAGTRWRVAPGVTLGLGGSVRRLEFRDSNGVLDDPTIAELHDVATIPGFEDGVDAARGELSLHVDRRRPRHAYQSPAAPSTGWAAQVFAGWQHGLDDGARFGYGGADVARAFDLFGGDRVLTLRATVDGVVGAGAEVPFVDLPTLGGTTLLRGYSTGRFRDRWAATASAEYMYPVTEGVGAFVFTDAGRVAAAPEDLADEAPRVGFGFGVQAHSRKAMLARLWVASSIDGGVIASLRVEPVLSARGREVVR